MDTKQFPRFSRPGHAVTGDRSNGRQKRQRVGKQFAHSIIDDHSRLAFTELHDDERAPDCHRVRPARAGFFAAHGIRAKRLQTDNAWTYIHNRSLAALLAKHAIEHRHIPRGPRNATGNLSATSRHSSANGASGSLPKLSRTPDGSRRLADALQHHPKPQLLNNRPPITLVRKQPRHDT